MVSIVNAKVSVQTLINRTKNKALSKKILKDNPRCRICGEKATQVHHLIPLNYGLVNEEAKLEIEILHKSSNMISLCHRCHKAVHGNSGCYKPKKLTLEKVRGIKRDYKRNVFGARSVAKKYGITHKMVRLILQSKCWRNS